MQKNLKQIHKETRGHFFQRIHRSWMLDFTQAWRALILGIILATSLGSASTEVDTYLLVAFFASLGFFAMVITLYFRPDVKLTHTLPKRSIAGKSIPFTVTVDNISEQAAREVVVHSADCLSWCKIDPQEQMAESIAPKAKQEFRFSAQFARRGSFIFPGFRCDTIFPFGFLRFGKGKQGKSPVLVYPDFTPLDTFSIPTGRRYQPGGIALASELGDCAEYIGSREYQEQDNPRDIDWRSWSRLGFPIVKEYQEEYFCRVALVLDTHLGKKIHARKRKDFEASLSHAASIADYLARQEYLIDIFAAGPDIYIMEAGRSLAHLDQILDVLACLEPCSENPFEIIKPALLSRMKNLSTIIVIFLDMDEPRRSFIDQLSAYGIGLKIIVCNSSLKKENFEFSYSLCQTL